MIFKERAWQRYAVAIAITIAAAAVRLTFMESLGTRAPFLTCYPAVIFAALYGGLGAGVLATVLSALLADYFWLDPINHLGIQHQSDWLSLGVFIVSCIMISWITEAMHRAQARAREAEVTSRDNLELSVRKRTAELEGEMAERKKAEDALRVSEQQYRLLFDANPNPMWVFDEESYRFVAVNAAAVQQYGWSHTEFLAMTVLDVRPPEDREAAQSLIHRQRGAREADIGVIRHHRKDGTLMEMQITVSTLSFEGRPSRLCSMNDVTERRRAEQAVRESELRFRVMFEGHRAIMLLIDPATGAIADANEAAAAFYGYPRQTLRSMRIEQINQLPPEQVVAERVKAVALAKERFVFPHRLAGGQIRWVEVDSSPVMVQGAPLLFSVIHDITERKHAEKERETTVEFLRLVNASTDLHGLIQAATTFFQRQSDCQAIGVRLKEGEDYPYFEARGFPADFLRTENSLCARSPDGELVPDSDGHPLIECMCGNVICGRTNPAKTFFTARGSFWTNCTADLLASQQRGRPPGAHPQPLQW